MQWPLFSLLVCATKASLETCQEEVSVCLQALLRGGSFYVEVNRSGGNLAQFGKHSRWEHSPWLGQEYRECKARLNYLSVHLSPQMSCASTTPIALSTPRRSASQWRSCSQMRACRNTTRSSPLSRQLPRFSKMPNPLLSLYIYPPLPPETDY